ncbi:hypothetical protein [Bosea sp. (in: a-proteobacteria)]|uniref:hypothetical protein n=1 Tax=Bosea sp. (in: a-proteobacteria) TaxID=1871050 RepID=UPI002FCA4B3F
MKTLLSSMALAAAIALTPLAAEAQTGAQTARKVFSGEPAHLQKAKTEKQARQDCQRQFRGAKDSKSALRVKMNACVQEAMQGN